VKIAGRQAAADDGCGRESLQGEIKKAPQVMRGLGIDCCQFLLLDNIAGRRAFGTVDNLESNPGAFGEGLEAVGLDCAVMHENIGAAILLDKAETL